MSDGWFVVNARDAAWLANDAFGARAVFEANGPVVRKRQDLEQRLFAQLGITLAVLEPGKPSGMYHAESAQEDFLVLAGECLLLVEGEERRLQAWDFVHCPSGTAHVFVATGDAACVIFMTGARISGKTIVYPESQLARRYGAGVERETTSPFEAYAPFADWQPERRGGGSDAVPWSGGPS